MRPRPLSYVQMLLALTGALVILAFAPPRVLAATYTVSNLNDAGAGSLRQAIIDANASASNDTVTFSVSGTITLNSELPYLLSNGTLTIDGGGNITIARSDTASDFRIFDISGTVTLNGLTIANGATPFDAGGSGIRNFGNLTLNNSTVSGNTIATFLGAFYNASGAVAVISNSTISDNEVIGGTADCAGICNEGAMTLNNSVVTRNEAIAGYVARASGIANYAGATLTLNNSTVSDNNIGIGQASSVNATAAGIYNEGVLNINGSTITNNKAQDEGGGIYNIGSVTITNSTFSDNQASYGGAILNSTTVDSTGSVTISGSTFTGNSGSEQGGAVWTNGVFTVSDSTLSGNSSGLFASIGGGGAIYNIATLTVTGSTLSGNTAGEGYGGAIRNQGTANITNTTISGNRGYYGGGGLANVFGTTTLTNSTVTDNEKLYNIYTPGGGGGLRNIGGVTTLRNTILANNSYGGDCANSATLNAESSIIGEGLGCVNGTNTNNLTGDPQLGALASNGGPTQTHALPTDSIGVNAGSNALVPAGINTDQRGSGFARVIAGTVDIGAYELTCPSFPHTVPAANSRDLIFSIECANETAGNQTINLTSSTYILTAVNESTSGLPLIINNGSVTINGNGATITRSSAFGTPQFRILRVQTGATVALNRMTISGGNAAGTDGGNIYNLGTLTIQDTTLTEGTADDGGAIVNHGTLTMLNSTVSGNDASTGNGGGIHNVGTLTLINVTVADNSASGGGGGVGNSGTSTLQNSIIADNTGGNNCGRFGGTIHAQNTLIEGSLSCVNGTNTNNLTADPALSSLDNFGGPTLTHSLIITSPAVDAGSAAFLVGGMDNDQRGTGFPRAMGYAVDMGAMELGCPTFPYTVPAGNEDALIFALLCANDTAGNQTINLTDSTYTLTAPYTSFSGLPSIASNGSITINGNGATLRRSGAAGTLEFRLLHVPSGSTLILDGITLSNGSVGAGAGGAVLSSGTLTIRNSTLNGNIANEGGAVASGSSGSVFTLNRSAVTGNTAFSTGGGIIIYGTATINNSTINSNTASGNGGGLIGVSGSTITVSNSTFSNNGATGGGGIYSRGVTTLNNTIVANSTQGPDLQRAGGTINAVNSLVENGAAAINGANINVLAGDPNLGPMADNGGPTRTRALLTGSMAINAGDNSLVPGGANDQRGSGYPRIANVTVDIGAYEVGEPLGHLDVQLMLQGVPPAPNPAWQTPVHFSVYAPGGALLFSADLTSDDNGQFSVPNLIVGSYDIVVKGMDTLARRYSNFAMVAGTNTLADLALLEGDANDDNIVGIADFSILASAFGTVQGDPNYNLAADFNNSGAVNISDFSLMASNFGIVGE